MSNTNDFFISRGVLMKYIGSDVHVIVPDKVKMIDSYAFPNSENIVSIQLPDSVTKIADHAFEDCISLQRINIPEGVKTIGSEAFRNCRHLKSIVFTGFPEKIGTLAFYGCWELGKDTSGLPESVQDFFIRIREGKLTLDEGTKLYKFSKAKGVVHIKEFVGVFMTDCDGTKYTYEFGKNENTLIIPVSIGDLTVVKAPSKQLPENAIVYCGSEHFGKLPRINKAAISTKWLMNDHAA